MISSFPPDRLPGSRGRVVSVQESRARAATACPAKVRKILPKVSLNPGQSVDIAQLSQLMIPVTVRAPCSGCGETIVATKFQVPVVATHTHVKKTWA